MSELDSRYKEKIAEILDTGAPVSPRGMKTRELQASQLRLWDSSHNIITLVPRKLNYAFSVAEWLWMLFGRDDVRFVSSFNKNIANFSDDGVSFYGAYGPRIAEQLEYVYNCLKNDSDTRQAIMTTWRPCPPKTKDVPCTLVFHFLIREGRLNLIVTMRSNDIWLGTPYDTFNFTQIQNFMAGMLGIPRGSYILTADSFHVYEQHWEQAKQLTSVEPSVQDARTNDIVFAKPGFHNYDRLRVAFDADVNDILSGTSYTLFDQYPVGIREHVRLLTFYSRKDGSHRRAEFWDRIYAGDASGG